ncbi:kelch-like protein 10 isoform X2 [Zootermopsis nevadensis]|uniref:kelch-like protein 10 isoform X2 n=1 Tax=Zootermopsis nevadensis TaxID=136037 RepID=UPI000B8EE3FC|nr:kelch-like protein 10 isoform X2 [Zootermopsis nevadensis]
MLLDIFITRNELSGMAEKAPLEKARSCVRKTRKKNKKESQKNTEATQKNMKSNRLNEDSKKCLQDSEKYEAQGARPKEGIRTKFNIYLDRAKKWNPYITEGKGKKPPNAGESGLKNNYEKNLQIELEKATKGEKPCVKWSVAAGLEGAEKVSKQKVIFPIKFPRVFTGKRKSWKGILPFGISNHPYVRENEASRPLISETLAFLDDSEMMTKEDKEFVTPRIADPRIPQDILFAIGGRYNGRLSDVIEAYDARADRWKTVKGVVDSIGQRYLHSTVVVGSDIYVIGGSTHKEVLRSCSCFNAVTKRCRKVEPTIARRSNLMVAFLRGFVYAMGGCSGGWVQRTVERYNCEKNSWWWIAAMNCARTRGDAAVLNDKIYVAGGNNGQNYLNSVEVYDPDTNQWTFVAPMHSQRTAFSCVALHGCLYALGGFNGSSFSLSTEKYDPAEDTWTEIPAMNIYSYYFHAEVIDDTIFVMGGNFDAYAHLSWNVSYFDNKENQWCKVTNMNVCRYALSICVIKNLPNASDYAYKHTDKLIEEKRKNKWLIWRTPVRSRLPRRRTH